VQIDTNKPSHTGKGIRTPSRKAITFLVVTAFLNAMGIGILGPVLPFIVQHYTGNPNTLATVVGWLVSSYAICQFVVAPALGMLSDRFGRRPLLLICLLGSAIGYLLFGVGGALWILFLGRIIDGLTGGNMSILFAYIGDISEPQERGKYFGLFGAASGIGFILGPVIGGSASLLSYQAPIYIAAGFTIANMLLGYFYLPESLSKGDRLAQTNLAELNPLKQLYNVFVLPQIRWLLVAFFFFCFPFAVYQAMTAVLIKESLGWNATNIGMIFLVLGVMDILMQGVLAGRLLPIFGEVKLTIGGLFCEMLAYILIGSIALIPSPVLLWIGIACFGFGSGLLEPALFGLVSRAAGPQQQGAVQSGGQSLQALASILGPLWGGLLYTQLGHASPYWSAAIFVALAILVTFLALPSLRTSPQKPQFRD
jgi:MFS transporter, DHA1 family, tetracycline resistance protein